VRGFLTRKEASDMANNCFDNRNMEINKENYNNPNIMEIRASLKPFRFGNKSHEGTSDL
jgi:hypothetical protein